ncbi:MAG: endonuclease III [Bacteroidales bacterium]|nr:endonuclease III [Bacteroidales bacterium]
MRTSERYKQLIEYFSKHQPEAETELVYEKPYELIVAVILSAQCTDKRVNIITPEFFEHFPNEKSLANAEFEDVFSIIKSCSFPNNKAKHLIGMAKTLDKEFKGVLPSDVEELQKLPGIGRKSANVIASVVFNKAVIAVDTHVFRVSNRIGLTTNAKTPLETEMQLTKHIPEDKRAIAHHWILLHGRYICKARKPDCSNCGIKSFCRYYENNNLI